MAENGEMIPRTEMYKYVETEIIEILYTLLQRTESLKPPYIGENSVRANGCYIRGVTDCTDLIREQITKYEGDIE